MEIRRNVEEHGHGDARCSVRRRVRDLGPWFFLASAIWSERFCWLTKDLPSQPLTPFISPQRSSEMRFAEECLLFSGASSVARARSMPGCASIPRCGHVLPSHAGVVSWHSIPLWSFHAGKVLGVGGCCSANTLSPFSCPWHQVLCYLVALGCDHLISRRLLLPCIQRRS